MGFFGWLGNKISKAAHAVGHFVSGIAHKVESTVGTILHTGENAVKTVYKDVKGGIKNVGGYVEKTGSSIIGDAKNVVNSGVAILKKGEDDVLGKKGIIQSGESGLFHTLMIPLILVGVGVIFLGRNSSAQVQYTR